MANHRDGESARGAEQQSADAADRSADTRVRYHIGRLVTVSRIHGVVADCILVRDDADFVA